MTTHKKRVPRTFSSSGGEGGHGFRIRQEATTAGMVLKGA